MTVTSSLNISPVDSSSELDTLKGLDEVQISSLVGEIVNFNRSKVSVIGIKTAFPETKQEQRNIVV